MHDEPKVMGEPTLIPNLFRTEYSNLVAVLCNTYGLANIQVAEDIVSDTFLLASQTWGKLGIPDNQAGWLYRVAKNRTLDYLRREKVRIEKVAPFVLARSAQTMQPVALDLSQSHIEDSQLRMLFTISHPSLEKKAQLILALRVLCGFSIDEVASSLFATKAAVNKTLYRAKKKLQQYSTSLFNLQPKDLPDRLDTVLTTVYLLFNEGYYSASKNNVLRRDMCYEAMRLGLLIVDNQQTSRPDAHALLALMCFHASRLDARESESNTPVLYYDQDQTRWEPALIQKGTHYLNLAATGDTISRYHIEAAIAYWHTVSDSEEKWAQILQLYNQLLQLAYSPVAALNRTYALARCKGNEAGLQEALKLKLDTHALYFCLLAALESDPEQKKVYLHKALQLATAKHEQAHIQQKLDELEGNV